MRFERERKAFEDYIYGKNLKHSEQRTHIMEAFLGVERHLTVDELYAIVKEKHPSIGFATIYRTVKLFCDCGICSELRFDDGTIRYEHLYGHEHHDHLICTECGKFEEVVDAEIEKLQDRLAKKSGFVLRKHRLQLYGVCKDCSKRKG